MEKRRQQNPLHDTVMKKLIPMLALYKQNLDMMLQSFGISAGQSAILMALLEKDGQSQTELAELLYVSQPSITNMVNRLQRSGIVERRGVSGDRRVSLIFLTDKGRRAARKMAAVIRFEDQSHVSGLHADELALFEEIIDRMTKTMRRQRTELLMLKRAQGEGKRGGPE